MHQKLSPESVRAELWEGEARHCWDVISTVEGAQSNGGRVSLVPIISHSEFKDDLLDLN